MYVPAPSVAEIDSLVPGANARSFVVRLTPLPLMTSAWLIVPSLRATTVTGVPALSVTAAGVIEYSLSERLTVDPDAAALGDADEVAVGELDGAAEASTNVNPGVPAPEPHAAASSANPANSALSRVRRPVRWKKDAG